MLRLLHNRGIATYALMAAGLAITAYFAWNAYPIGAYSAEQFGTPGGPAVLGTIAALVMGVLVFILFFGKEYLREDIAKYSELRNDPRFIKAFKWFTWIVLALEFCSVAFRWYLLGYSRLGFVMLAIGIVGIAMTYILGLVLHAVVNRPAAVAAAHLRERAAREVFEDGEKVLPKLSIGQKRKVAGGDASPIDDVRDRKWKEREAAVAEIARKQKQADDDEAERVRIAKENDRKNDRFYQQMVSPAAEPDPTPEPLELPAQSQNGHSRNPH